MEKLEFNKYSVIIKFLKIFLCVSYAAPNKETTILCRSWSPFTQGYLFVCFVALRPKSTAMVIAGRSVHLTTLIPGQA